MAILALVRDLTVIGRARVQFYQEPPGWPNNTYAELFPITVRTVTHPSPNVGSPSLDDEFISIDRGNTSETTGYSILSVERDGGQTFPAQILRVADYTTSAAVAATALVLPTGGLGGTNMSTTTRGSGSWTGLMLFNPATGLNAVSTGTPVDGHYGFGFNTGFNPNFVLRLRFFNSTTGAFLGSTDLDFGEGTTTAKAAYDPDQADPRVYTIQGTHMDGFPVSTDLQSYSGSVNIGGGSLMPIEIPGTTDMFAADISGTGVGMTLFRIDPITGALTPRVKLLGFNNIDFMDVYVSAVAPPIVPTFTSIVPNTGPLAGSAVTINGTNYDAGTITRIDGTALGGQIVTPPNTITGTTPSHAAGLATLTITRSDGESLNVGNVYTYADPAPTVSAVNPSSSSQIGGTSITITGSGFIGGETAWIGTPSPGTTVVGLIFVNSTTLTGTTRGGLAPGAYNVRVSNVNGAATLVNGFTYTTQPAPTISSILPSTGTGFGNTLVTVTGTNYVTGTVARLDGVALDSQVILSPTQIQGRTPSHANGVVDVRVENAFGNATVAGGYTYATPPPSISSISPTSGSQIGGTFVAIDGDGFIAGSDARLDNVSLTGQTIVNVNRITGTSVAHGIGAVTVSVTNANGTGQLGSGYSYTTQPSPTVGSISPTFGPPAGGTGVTVTGTNFISGTSASIGGTALSGQAVVNSMTITGTTATKPAGTYNITATNTFGTGILANGFTYALASLSAIAPIFGPISGGTPIVVTGTGFDVTSVARLNGVPLTGQTVVNSTTITGTTPASLISGLVTLSVKTSLTTVLLPNAFLYVDFRWISPIAGQNVDTGHLVRFSWFDNDPTLPAHRVEYSLTGDGGPWILVANVSSGQNYVDVNLNGFRAVDGNARLRVERT